MIRFLSLEAVLVLHLDQLENFGGLPGVRDPGLLESAVMTPQSTMGGEFLYGDVIGMAAAYMTGLVRNHPFLDGNKRVGLVAGLTFLIINGYPAPMIDKPQLEEMILRLAAGLATRDDVEDFLRKQLAGK
jgi:death-on-curing protein